VIFLMTRRITTVYLPLVCYFFGDVSHKYTLPKTGCPFP
jgi:hypothetical protein